VQAVNTEIRLVREIEYMAFLMADRIVAVSGRVKHMIAEEYSIPEDKIEVVHNSIDQSFLEPLDDDNAYAYLEHMKQHGWKVVVNIGRLTIQKGLPHFLRAAGKVAKYSPKTFFLIVGDGEQRDELNRTGRRARNCRPCYIYRISKRQKLARRLRNWRFIRNALSIRTVWLNAP
jgi:glycosyltransferase involved in cell wall biosynthesis